MKQSVLFVAAIMLPMWGVAATGFECLLEPSQVVEIRSPADGVIESIAVTRGDLIQRGQVLVRLRSEIEVEAVNSARYRLGMEGQLETSRNRLAYADKKLERTANLVAQKFVSAQALDEAETEQRLAQAELQSAVEAREMARIELQRATEVLALRTLKAPFYGVVVDRMLNPGDLAEAGSGRKAVLKVAQIDPVRADVPLPASLFGKVRIGSTAVITASVGARSFNGIVRAVDRTIDAASDTFVARVEIANPRGDVPVGSRCSAAVAGIAAATKAPLPAVRPSQP